MPCNCLETSLGCTSPTAQRQLCRPLILGVIALSRTILFDIKFQLSALKTVFQLSLVFADHHFKSDWLESCFLCLQKRMMVILKCTSLSTIVNVYCEIGLLVWKYYAHVCNDPSLFCFFGFFCTGLAGAKYVSFEERQWHSECFTCGHCSMSLVGRGFLTQRDNILCTDCGREK